MVTIALYFVAGRYHSTPWGSHVNEGWVEWPPNPWRVLRALLAVGFNKLGWNEVPEEARTLIGKLAATLPEFHLPRGEVAHSRHYMPNGSFHAKQKNLEGTDKVLDSFVRLRPETPLLIRWPVELTTEERNLLADLLNAMTYFGRAESWCNAALYCGELPQEGWACPAVGRTGRLASADQVALLTAQSADAYQGWREISLKAALEAEEEKRGKKLTSAQGRKVASAFPDDLIGCLLRDTSELQKQGWNQPPGSRRVLYNRPAGTLQPRPIRRRRGQRRARCEAALLALSSDSVRGDRLPKMIRAIRQMEFIHQVLAGMARKDSTKSDYSVLTGRAPDGNRLASGHQHAHYFPLDLDIDGRIDHVLVYAPAGLDAPAQRLVTRVRRTWAKGEENPIFVTCAGFGDVDLFRRQLTDVNQRPLSIIPPRPSHCWVSYTPYVPARFLKPKNGRYTLSDDVQRELSVRGLPRAKTVHSFSELGEAGKRELVERRFFEYVRTRRPGKPQPPQPNVYGIRITFAEPVAGPIALGYASHYGLGLFEAHET